MSQSVKKEDLEALEAAVNEIAKSHSALVQRVEELAARKVASISVQRESPRPIHADPFELKGIGTVRLKYPQVQVDGVLHQSVVVAKDAKLAGELYEKHPHLFIIEKSK